MSIMRRLSQPIFCIAGLHDAPPPRSPHGPIVAMCPCCGKVVYFYGLAAHGLNVHPSLALPSFPRVLGVLPPARM
ncbi:MAG TPA: hypothetical protein VFB38_06100 [Chthonomonadaceae bacterium]|nr:hypothetical protein [Chthonomonadaceae bacterium]